MMANRSAASKAVSPIVNLNSSAASRSDLGGSTQRTATNFQCRHMLAAHIGGEVCRWTPRSRGHSAGALRLALVTRGYSSPETIRYYCGVSFPNWLQVIPIQV